MEREVETLSAARNVRAVVPLVDCVIHYIFPFCQKQLASGASALEAEKNRLQITVSELQTASTNWKKRVEAQELVSTIRYWQVDCPLRVSPCGLMVKALVF